MNLTGSSKRGVGIFLIIFLSKYAHLTPHTSYILSLNCLCTHAVILQSLFCHALAYAITANGICLHLLVPPQHPLHSNTGWALFLRVGIFWDQPQVCSKLFAKNCPYMCLPSPVSHGWTKQKKAWYTLFAHTHFPRTSGNLEVSINYTNLCKTCRLLPCERCLLLTMLCVDND